MALTAEDVIETALLARIELDVAEIEDMRQGLAAVLGYVDALAALEVALVEPMTHAVLQAGPLREDVLGPQLDADVALAGAPRRDGALYVVPKVVEGSG
jgi:aspartyl/glutamyl-tRNA(Asn/Gln) amidotransferase C subunit